MTIIGVPIVPDDLKIVEDFAERLRNQFGSHIITIILFGSRARGDAEQDSDADIAVILDESDPEISNSVRYIAADASLDFGLILSTRVWDQKHWEYIKNLNTSLYQNIKRDGIEMPA